MGRANDIFEAALPKPYRVLGLRLRPFSLGHYMILRRHGCAFVADDKSDATRDDLVFACLVCSMTFDEFDAWIQQGRVRWIERLRSLLSFSATEIKVAFLGSQAQLDVVRWGRKVGSLWSFKPKAELFMRYLADNAEMPKYWIEKEGPGGGAHWAQTALNVLTGELHLTRKEALEMPLREALLHCCAHGEAMGTLRLMTPEEIAIAEGGNAGGN